MAADTAKELLLSSQPTVLTSVTPGLAQLIGNQTTPAPSVEGPSADSNENINATNAATPSTPQDDSTILATPATTSKRKKKTEGPIVWMKEYENLEDCQFVVDKASLESNTSFTFWRNDIVIENVEEAVKKELLRDKPTIYYDYTHQNTKPLMKIPNPDQVPFISIGLMDMRCRFYDRTKRHTVPANEPVCKSAAKIIQCIFFPHYKALIDNDALKKAAVDQLKRDITTGKVYAQQKFYMAISDHQMTSHDPHPTLVPPPLDRRVQKYLQEHYCGEKSDIVMNCNSYDTIQQEVFTHIDNLIINGEMPPVDRENQRFYPLKKRIKAHVHLWRSKYKDAQLKGLPLPSTECRVGDSLNAPVLSRNITNVSEDTLRKSRIRRYKTMIKTRCEEAMEIVDLCDKPRKLNNMVQMVSEFLRYTKKHKTREPSPVQDVRAAGDDIVAAAANADDYVPPEPERPVVYQMSLSFQQTEPTIEAVVDALLDSPKKGRSGGRGKGKSAPRSPVAGKKGPAAKKSRQAPQPSSSEESDSDSEGGYYQMNQDNTYHYYSSAPYQYQLDKYK